MSSKEDSPSRYEARRLTLWFLTATVLLTIAALLVGISDNPPGILLLYGAGLTLVLAVTHRWRTPQKFGFLLLGALLGFFIMVVVHNFAEVGADRIAHIPVLAPLLSAISVIGFFLAVIVCPAAGMVGAIGSMITLAREARSAA